MGGWSEASSNRGRGREVGKKALITYICIWILLFITGERCSIPLQPTGRCAYVDSFYWIAGGNLFGKSSYGKKSRLYLRVSQSLGADAGLFTQIKRQLIYFSYLPFFVRLFVFTFYEPLSPFLTIDFLCLSVYP